jgi:hypothetical protein
MLPCFHAGLLESSMFGLGFHRCECENEMDPWTFVLVMTDAEYCAGKYSTVGQ